MEMLLEVDTPGLSPHALPAGDAPDLIPRAAKISPCADQATWAIPGLKSQLNELQLNSGAVRGAERRAGRRRQDA